MNESSQRMSFQLGTERKKQNKTKKKQQPKSKTKCLARKPKQVEGADRIMPQPTSVFVDVFLRAL